MSKHPIPFRLALFATLSLATAVSAQETTTDVDSKLSRYTTEIIIFSYSQDVSTGSETFPADAPPVRADFSVSSEPDDDAPMPLPAPAEMVLLSEDQLSMGEIYDRLRRLDVYKPLMHFGWTQAMLAETETRAQPLSFFGTPPRGLDGELALYLGRFLHLVVDLQLAGPSAPPRNRDYSRDSEWTYPVNYRLSEDRIIRNGELRYYDHPKFGVLAKVTRLQEPENEEFLGE